MSIVTHYYSVLGVIGVIFLNFFMLIRANDIVKYQRQMSLFSPIGMMPIGGVIFTGVVMMAAKHLDFTVENILMILFAIIILFLESRRLKTLKYLHLDEATTLQTYKQSAKKLLLLELFTTLSISVWMWL